jgi:hypothetical protein
MLTNGVLTSLQMDSNSSTSVASPGQEIQLAVIRVCTAAFRRYPAHRETCSGSTGRNNEQMGPNLFRRTD